MMPAGELAGQPVHLGERLRAPRPVGVAEGDDRRAQSAACPGSAGRASPGTPQRPGHRRPSSPGSPCRVGSLRGIDEPIPHRFRCRVRRFPCPSPPAPCLDYIRRARRLRASLVDSLMILFTTTRGGVAVAETIQQQLRERLDDPAVAVKYGDEQQTWRESTGRGRHRGRRAVGHRRPQSAAARRRPAGQYPDMLTALAAAGLGGCALCGINNTRRGAALRRDILHADCQILLTDLTIGICWTVWSCPVRAFEIGTEGGHAVGRRRSAHPASRGRPDGHLHADLHPGTSGEPKAVQVPHVTVLIAAAHWCSELASAT